MARSGYKPRKSDAVKGKCCECRCNYADGRAHDCQVPDCPIYPEMPYRKGKPNLIWIFGRWANHEKKRRVLGLTQEQYLKQYIIKPNGKLRIGFNAMARAKCFRCMNDFDPGGGEKGRMDCCIRDCPIYYWMPYRQQDPILDWIFDLSYTTTHQQRRTVEGLTRPEYYAKYLLGHGPMKKVRLVANEEDRENA